MLFHSIDFSPQSALTITAETFGRRFLFEAWLFSGTKPAPFLLTGTLTCSLPFVGSLAELDSSCVVVSYQKPKPKPSFYLQYGESSIVSVAKNCVYISCRTKLTVGPTGVVGAKPLYRNRYFHCHRSHPRVADVDGEYLFLTRDLQYPLLSNSLTGCTYRFQSLRCASFHTCMMICRFR